MKSADRLFADAVANSTSPSMLSEARVSAPQAWEKLCRLYGPLVYSWARKAGLDEDDAADVGQEVFRTVAARIGEFERLRGRGSFRSWLKQITRHKIGDHWRREAKTPRAEGGTDAQQRIQEVIDPKAVDEADDDSHDSHASGDIRNVLQSALNLIRGAVKPQTWQVFWRLVVDGNETDQVAAEFQMSRKAVRQAKYRVLRRLRQEFGDLLDDL